jgi:PHD/YefM family antitoxin component YafN of YafNO toxin-antitoxin module
LYNPETAVPKRESPIEEYTISEFREQVPHAFDLVTARRGRRIRVVRRGSTGRAVLMNEADVERLEMELADARRALAAAAASGQPRPITRILGTGRLLVPADDVLRRSRQRQRDLAEAKRRRLLEP